MSVKGCKCKPELELDYFIQFAIISEDRETKWFGPFGYIQLAYGEIRVSTVESPNKTLAIFTHHTQRAQVGYPMWAISDEFLTESDEHFYSDVFIVATAAGEGPPQ